MLKKYSVKSSQEELTNDKDTLRNVHLNTIGKNLLEGKLFVTNNDFLDSNGNSYATAFEAVIGLISLISLDKAFRVLDKYLK